MKSKTLNRNKINGNQMEVDILYFDSNTSSNGRNVPLQQPFYPSQILKIILSMLRIELEKFFCFTSNFKLEQKVTVERKVFQESLAKTDCV